MVKVWNVTKAHQQQWPTSGVCHTVWSSIIYMVQFQCNRSQHCHRTQLFPTKIRVLVPVPTNEMSKYLVQILIIHQSGFSSSCRVTSFGVSGLQNWSRLIRRSVQHEFRHWVNRWIFFNLVLYHHGNFSNLFAHTIIEMISKRKPRFSSGLFWGAILFFCGKQPSFPWIKVFHEHPDPPLLMNVSSTSVSTCHVSPKKKEW